MPSRTTGNRVRHDPDLPRVAEQCLSRLQVAARMASFLDGFIDALVRRKRGRAWGYRGYLHRLREGTASAVGSGI